MLKNKLDVTHKIGKIGPESQKYALVLISAIACPISINVGALESLHTLFLIVSRCGLAEVLAGPRWSRRT